MADYYPLIARAVAGLDPTASGESRRALYERARSALIAQLRGVQPPLSESEITRERLSLEEAVRKVESEAAARARAEQSRKDQPKDQAKEEPPSAEPPRGDAGRGKAGDAFRGGTRPKVLDPFASPPVVTGGKIDRPRENRPPRDTSRPQPPSQDSRTQDSRAQSARGSSRPAPAQQAGGMRGFRDVVADADDLGRAAAQANRSARKTYSQVPSPSPEFDRLEPSLEVRGADALPYNYDEPPNGDARPPTKGAPPPRPKPKKAARPKSARAFPFKSAIAVGLVLIVTGLALWQGPKVVTLVRGLMRPAAPVEQAKQPENATRPKIPDRVGQPGSQIAPVAQRVVLYDEDPSEPQGKQYVGSVIWRTEQVKGTGNTTDLAVRADIEIPERKFKMTLSIRRNSDASLPASHTAELTFVLPPDFNGGGVSNVPGVLMKSNEQARGTPLAGLAVKVTDGFFLVGLSNVEADRARNIQLLKERSWFDVPLVYTNQRRAIIAIEKGAPGERAFNEAFAAWGQ